ncbi:MAG: hypothetical protein COB78_13265 [Hyphomicrobiales bacterium]|nr:MAG: hypothetical protein COB78_13265 [Hyphomicrobiales bacterium]
MPESETFLFLSFNDDGGVNETLNGSAERLSTRLEILSQLCEATTSDEIKAERKKSNFIDFAKRMPLNLTYCDILLRQKAACRRFLLEGQIDTVIVCEDGPGGCSALISVAQDMGKLVADMPFGIGEMHDYEMYLENRAEENSLNLVSEDKIGAALRKYAPKWILPSAHGDLTLFASEFVLARIAVGLDLPEPWVVHGGTSDVMFAESEAMEHIYQRENVPAEKRVMTGSCYADVVYDEIFKDEALKRAYETASLIDPDNPKILVALPPSYHGERKAEFETYQETVELLLSGCKEAHPRAHITVSVHPATDDATRQIVSDLADEVSDEWLLKLIAKTDAFIPVFSSTIRWALMAKKPIVNYDLYQFGFLTYDKSTPVFTTKQLKVAMENLKGILASPESYHLAALDVSKCSAEWGMMDGQNFERIWQTFQGHRKLKQNHRKLKKEAADKMSLAKLALSLFKKARD